MAYRFNGTSDLVEFAISPVNGYTAGPWTSVFFFKRNATGFDDFIHIGTSSSNRILHQIGSSENQRFLKSSLCTGTSLASTTVWYLVAVTAATGSVVARFHIHDGTSWTHVNGTGSLANVTIAGTDRLTVGNSAFTGSNNPLSADVVCAAVKKSDSTDLQIETLSRTAFSTWAAFGFDWLIGFDTSLKSGGVLQDQASPGTGDQIAISGTSLVSDPPGWSWASAATPVADFTGTPTSGTEPLSVAFTDASTNTPTSWAWTFGDGGTSTSQNPSHSYTTAGTYTVTLQATNSAGSNTKTRTGYITVADQPRPIRINTSQGWADIGDATSFVSGTGAPTAAVGATGAVYLNTATGLFYGPKTGGAWPGTPVPATAPAIPYGTTLPGSPSDGLEAILVDSTTSPTYQWRFRYNAGSSSTYKWELVGGAAAIVTVAAGETTTSAAPVDLTTVGPSFTLPRNGDYMITWGAGVAASTAGQTMVVAVIVNGVSVADISPVANAANMLLRQMRTRPFPALTASLCKLAYGTSGGTASFERRDLIVIPSRVS